MSIKQRLSQLAIRHAQASDAVALMALRKKLFAQTHYMLLEDGEYRPSVESEAAFINSFSQSDNSTVLLAFKGVELLGFMGVAGGSANRIRHCASIFLGVDQGAWGQGVGWQLMQGLFAWLATTSLKRLSLSTAVDNERALALYKKAGFVIEGVKKGDILLADQLVDSYFMAKLLDNTKG